MEVLSKSDPAARVTVTNTLVASPGQCGICGTSDKNLNYVDPRLDFEFYGTLYFCQNCVRDFANALGWGDDAQMEYVRNKRTQAEDLLAEAYTEIKELHDVVDSLRRYGYVKSDAGRSAGSVGGTLTGPDEFVPINDGEVPVRKLEVSESDDESGPDDLSGIAGNGRFF